MSEVTSPTILNSTGQDIALALTGLATAIANKPDPAIVTPVMDGAGAVGTSARYSREDHQHPSDTSKANQTQIAVVESGSTASRAYAVGEYFCWQGTLYRATAAISNGGSFTPGTNCESTSAGAELKGKLSVKRVTIAPGQTLTINVLVTFETAAFLVGTQGARAAVDSLHYSVLMGGRPEHSIAQSLVAGSDISTSITASGFTISNNNATYNAEAIILVFRGLDNMTFVVS